MLRDCSHIESVAMLAFTVHIRGGNLTPDLKKNNRDNLIVSLPTARL